MYENDFSNENKNGNNMYHYEEPKKPEQKGNPKGNTGRKIALGICCGLLFGIFAGVGFEAVTTASSLVKNKTEVTITTVEESKNTANSADAAGQDVEAPESELTKELKESADNQLATTVMNDQVATTVTDVTSVVKNVMPAVVSVSNKFVETTSFFGQQYSSEGMSSGSGIIVGKNDTELLLVSNNHVVQDAEELTVQFVDGSQVQAQIKGTDADKDLAVIAVDLTDISADTMNSIAIADLGDSDALIVGEPVIAIGNALGYGQSVTTGVVSALHRAIPNSNAQLPGETEEQDQKEVNTFIQTDAAINPGNSGGALLNSRGQVIGINSNKIGGSTVEGMGYAIPISDAKPIIENLMTKETRKKVNAEQTGYLGITGIDVSEETSQVYGMPKGVYVSSVSSGTGAFQAGLVRGDVITGINGEEITSMVELKDELSYYAIGDIVELTIMQGSPSGYQSKTVLVTLGAAPTTIN